MTYVFDLDGTLIDSRKRHWMLMEKLLHESGIITDSNFAYDFMRFKADGCSGNEYLTEVLGLSTEVATEIQSKWVLHIEDAEWLQYDELYDDALITLQKIDSEILLLTIRNNSEGLRNELLRLGLADSRLVILPHGKSKANVLKSCGDCLMIGDTEIDYQAAKEANADYYILNRGFRSKKFWDKMGIVSYSDLYSLKLLR